MLRQPSLCVNNLRINEDEFGVRVLFESYVDHGDAARDANLGRGEADAVRFIHRLEHVVEKLLEFFVEDGDRLCLLLQNWIAEFYNRVDHQ
jgi:hypothetical protein